MHASRPYVAHQEREIRRQLSLYVQVPLHYVVTLWMGIDKRATQAGWACQQRVGVVVELRLKGDGVGYAAELVERRGPILQEYKLIWEGKHIEHARTGTDRRFSIAERIP